MTTYIDLQAGANPEAHVEAVEQQRQSGLRCAFAVGDRVRVLDFREDVHNYSGTVVGLHETGQYGWYCTIERDDGKGRTRKGTAKLRRTATPAPRRPAGPIAPARA